MKGTIYWLKFVPSWPTFGWRIIDSFETERISRPLINTYADGDREIGIMLPAGDPRTFQIGARVSPRIVLGV